MERAGGQGYHVRREGGQKHVLILRSGRVKDLAVYLRSFSAGMRSRLLGRSRRRFRLLSSLPGIYRAQLGTLWAIGQGWGAFQGSIGYSWGHLLLLNPGGA